jgi:hypothetical protein
MLAKIDFLKKRVELAICGLFVKELNPGKLIGSNTDALRRW